MVTHGKTCIIFNPASGKGRGLRRISRLGRHLGPAAILRPTSRPGHAEVLAMQAAAEGFDVVAAAGGDGTVHEVANGLLQSRRTDVALAVVPIGSANDYAHSLGRTPARQVTEPDRTARSVDVGVVRDGRGRERYFVNGLGLGFNGAVTMESRKISKLQGVALYGVALLRALWLHFKQPVTEVTIDGVSRRVPTLALSVALGAREGNFVLAPDARLDDGWFDYLHAGALTRLALLGFVPGMITGRLPREHPLIWRGRCKQMAISSIEPVAMHLDGELFSRPEDGLREIEVRILPGRLRVCLAETLPG